MSWSASSSQNQNRAGTITGHHGHPGHILVPAEKDAMLHICKDCKDQILGLGSCYKCTHCNEYLHGACLNAKPNSTKLYPFIPNFWLKFSPEKRGTIYCTACCSYIRGIMYTGSHANKNYHLHPQCLDGLPQTLRPGSINSELELKLCCRMQTNMKCAFCETDDDEGWCYGIISNRKFKFACHVRCLKSRLVKDWFRERIPVELPSRQAYFESLYQRDLQKITVMIGGLALTAAALGLDLMISAFVGAPLATFLSLALGVSVEAAKKRLEAAEEKLRNGKKYSPN